MVSKPWALLTRSRSSFKRDAKNLFFYGVNVWLNSSNHASRLNFFYGGATLHFKTNTFDARFYKRLKDWDLEPPAPTEPSLPFSFFGVESCRKLRKPLVTWEKPTLSESTQIPRHGNQSHNRSLARLGHHRRAKKGSQDNFDRHLFSQSPRPKGRVCNRSDYQRT